jgi:hypothetical protein
MEEWETMLAFVKDEEDHRFAQFLVVQSLEKMMVRNRR